MESTNKKNNTKTFSIFLLFVFLLPCQVFASEENRSPKQLYLDGDFKAVVELLTKRTFQTLNPENKLLYVESLIRSGDHEKAGKFLEKIKKNGKKSFETEALEGMNLLAMGKLFKAENIINKVIKSDPGSVRIIQARLLLLLYLRRFADAEIWLNRLSLSDSEFKSSHLFYLLGLELFKGKGEPFKISGLYRQRMKEKKKFKNRQYYSDLKSNYKLFRKKIIRFFIESGSDKIIIPFEKKRGNLKSIRFSFNGENFSILLDTGNTVGWLVHSRVLRKLLKPERGGRTITQIGSESEKLDGFNIYCKTLAFDSFKIRNLFGIYVPKPNPDFFDANLNPIFIKNRVVTFDFINDTFILRTKERFSQDISSVVKREVMRVPWFGHKYPLVPVLFNRAEGLAVIETGAEDITIRLDNAKELKLPMEERSKYLSNGKIFKYFLTFAEVQLGKYLFVRNNAEVWPIEKFLNRISGFSPHLIFGPKAFEDKFVVSFLPSDNMIVFEYEKK
ncbi:MAG: hypothetical protein ABFR75_11445 [Acidobacteriota bacterium]